MKRIACLCSVLLACAAMASHAQEYPTKPIRFIVPFAPGGGTDLLARAVAPGMSESLGRQVIVENRTGAGGNIATEYVAKAPADGYTILLAYIGPIAVSPSLYKNLGFDPVKDFRGVSLMASIPLVLVVHPSLPVKSVKQLIALAKSRPGQLSYGSAGNGTAQQLAGELFKLSTGTNVVAIPYRGGAPATTALLTGEVQLLFTGALAVFPHVKVGRLRALAVTTSKRLPSAPELPTVAESGVPGFEVVSWNGVLVPSATPPAIVTRLHAAATQALAVPETRERLHAQGLEIVASTPDDFDRFIKSEIAKWAKVVKAAGLRAE
ncbi:MAG TPA: tripartite tricarboxylate transporter substrate binding protein [Burkholderiales bacterium]|nr:tripartite tricarboxylate transporter substrate binding protein [Burkholderiales bacterium]